MKKIIKFLLTSVTLAVTILCIYIFYLAQHDKNNMNLLWFNSEFPMIWMPVTANFVHIELPHILSNLTGFILFGSLLEYKIGKLNYIQLILGTGGGALSCQVLFDIFVLNIGGVYLGLSAIAYGVICGLFLFLILELVYSPNFNDISNIVYTFIGIGIYVWVILYLFITQVFSFGINTLAILSPELNLERTFTAYLAHIMGMIIGMIYTYIIFQTILRKNITDTNKNDDDVNYNDIKNELDGRNEGC